VRTVSDTEENNGVETFELNSGLAAEKSFDIVCAILKNLKD
jgi:hypothetical protein